jgi:hypothetical protein
MFFQPSDFRFIRRQLFVDCLKRVAFASVRFATRDLISATVASRATNLSLYFDPVPNSSAIA